MRVTVTFEWTFSLDRSSLPQPSAPVAPPWQDGAFGVDGLPASLVGSNWLSELAALRRAQKANWIPREVPATIRPPGAPPLRLCGDVSAGSSAKPARERGLSLDPYRSRTPVRCFVAPCLMPFDANFRPLIPSLSFPPPLTKVLPAQVARSARRRSTSRLHERARHVWRRGIVKRLLRYRLEGHFRSQSFISRILIDATP